MRNMNAENNASLGEDFLLDARAATLGSAFFAIISRGRLNPVPKPRTVVVGGQHVIEITRADTANRHDFDVSIRNKVVGVEPAALSMTGLLRQRLVPDRGPATRLGGRNKTTPRLNSAARHGVLPVTELATVAREVVQDSRAGETAFTPQAPRL